jgi:hypothetical protein
VLGWDRPQVVAGQREAAAIGRTIPNLEPHPNLPLTRILIRHLHVLDQVARDLGAAVVPILKLVLGPRPLAVPE